jgi:hypothetical protein
MIRDWVDAIEIFCADVWVLLILLAGWIVCDVDELTLEIFLVSNAVFVIAAVPDLSCGLFARGERVAAFDVLNAFCC